MKIIRICAALVASTLAFSTHASNLGYTTLGIDLRSTHFDEDIDLIFATVDSTAGLDFYGSYQFTENFFLYVSGAAEGASTLDDAIDFTQSASSLGAGFALPVGSMTDVVFTLALVSVEQEVCYNGFYSTTCFTADDDGFSVGAGVRHMLTPNVEINAEYAKVKLDDWDDDEILNVGGAIWFATHHSIRLNLGDTDGAKTSALGYRYTF